MSQGAAFDAVLLTCEHARNAVPQRFAKAFRTAAERRLLSTHRGYDIGALAFARKLARSLAPHISALGPVEGRVSRLLVDLNRSPHHRGLFSEFSRRLGGEVLQALMSDYYLPHHAQVRKALFGLLQRHERVLHVGVHSFVPELHGQVRRADIGLLYDPQRAFERSLAHSLQASLVRPPLGAKPSGLIVRRNYPYRGDADGLTKALRQETPASRYAGIELELNQQLLSSSAGARQALLAFSAALLSAEDS